MSKLQASLKTIALTGQKRGVSERRLSRKFNKDFTHGK